MAKRVDPRRVKIHWTLTPEEWARKLGVHKNTVRRWIKSDGLPAITDQRPYLIRGIDLKTFLTENRKKKRFDCRPGQMACFSCNRAREPANIGLEYTPIHPTSGRLVGLCTVCLATMSRMIRISDIDRLFPGFEVTQSQHQPTLCGSTNHRVNVAFVGSFNEHANNTLSQPENPSSGTMNQTKGELE